ncbi:MAG: hypothetical protein HY704_13450 [Gemmatimonadetes bacterium]|nr:hypothetical protein [Gemmatimonadota bacterium]
MAAAALLQGCGELASGGVQGEAVAFVAGNGNGGGSGAVAGAAAVVPLGDEGDAAPPGENGIRGTVSTDVRVFVRAPGGTWIELTAGERPASVDIEGKLEVEVGRRKLDAGTYGAMRVVFRRVDADVRDGLIIDGLPLVGRIAVDFGTGDTLQVERSVAITVREDTPAELVVDLNSETWLRGANPVARVVPSAIFRNAIRIRVR